MKMAQMVDSEAGYGLVSRVLHWGMALLLLWQFTSVFLPVLVGRTPVTFVLVSSHQSVGFTLWLLVLLRGAWGLANASRRPAHSGAPWLAKAAKMGHLALYALMVVVPTLSISRALGSEHGFSLYGVQLIAEGREPILWLTTPANLIHGFLGWTLFVLIAGHIGMALVHALVLKDGSLARMAKGSSSAA